MNEQRALSTLAAGNWQAAAQHLRKAADAAASRGEKQRAAHYEQMAATLFRATGSLDDALAAAARTAERDRESPRARFAAHAERAETLLERGDYADAAACWRAALQEADAIPLPPRARATVLRRLATTLAQGDEAAQAWATMDEAASLSRKSEHPADVPWIELEQAQLALAAGHLQHARAVLERPGLTAAAAADRAVEAERCRALADYALADGDLAAAEKQATRAIEAALEAVAPVTYFGAAVTLARAADAQADRATCYRVLATAWVTLADLLDGPIAQSWVEPVLQAFRIAWGTAAFNAVKAEHDHARRASRAQERQL